MTIHSRSTGIAILPADDEQNRPQCEESYRDEPNRWVCGRWWMTRDEEGRQYGDDAEQEKEDAGDTNKNQLLPPVHALAPANEWRAREAFPWDSA